MKIGDIAIIDIPQDWSIRTRYGLTSKLSVADTLTGAEDRARYSEQPRRTYRYGITARGLAQRMNINALIQQVLAAKRCVVPIWAKARRDFSRSGFDFTFAANPPAVASYWLLQGASQSSVLEIDSITGLTATFTVVADSQGGDGMHEGVLVPLLTGYMKPPRSVWLGGDLESFEIEFIEAAFYEPPTVTEPLQDWTFTLSNASIDSAGSFAFDNAPPFDLSEDGAWLVLAKGRGLAFYQLREPWNPNSAEFVGFSPDIVPGNFSPRGLSFNKHGDYILAYGEDVLSGDDNFSLRRYALSPPFQPDSLTRIDEETVFSRVEDNGSGVAAPQHRAVVYYGYERRVYQRNLSQPQDFSNVSDVIASLLLPLEDGVDADDTEVGDMAISPLGKRLFISMQAGHPHPSRGLIYEYQLPTAFQLNNAILFDSISYPLTANHSGYMRISPDGQFLFINQSTSSSSNATRIDRYLLRQ